MKHFKRLTYRSLKESGDRDLIPHIAWNVIEDPKWEDASMSKVRA